MHAVSLDDYNTEDNCALKQLEAFLIIFITRPKMSGVILAIFNFLKTVQKGLKSRWECFEMILKGLTLVNLS